MANTFELIQAVNLTGTQSSIDFTVIPSNYTDLVVKYSTRITSADTTWHMRINGSSSSIYSGKYLQGTGSGTGYSGSWSAQNNDNFMVTNSSGYTASTFSNVEIYFPNYTSSNNKAYSVDEVTENNATGAVMFLNAGLFASSSAISSISFYYSGSSDIAAYSTAYLYGVKNA